MARLAILTDRLPDDPDWKGATTWDIIRELAESQHEVAVFTTEDPDRIPFTHPRLTVARPASAFTADKLPKWMQALLTFRPEVLHTFALKPSAHWPSLTIWPYLDAVCKVLPGMKRVSTMFDAEDFSPRSPAHVWHSGSDSWTVFSARAESEARSVYHGRIDLVPLEELRWEPTDFETEARDSIFVPAPVSEWPKPQQGLALLADYLYRHPEAHVCINGGWGDLSLGQRRRGWQLLSQVSARIRLIEAQSLARSAARAATARQIWVEALRPDSWRYLVSVRLAEHLGKELIGPQAVPALTSGSTANHLSRLYLS